MHAGGRARGGARWAVHVLTWPARIVLFEGEAVHAGGRARGGARRAVHVHVLNWPARIVLFECMLVGGQGVGRGGLYMQSLLFSLLHCTQYSRQQPGQNISVNMKHIRTQCDWLG